MSQAEQIRTLFPPGPEHLDLLQRIQDWSEGDVDLPSPHAQFILSTIERGAIPRWENVVARQAYPALRDDAVQTLATWKGLRVLLESGLRG